MSEDINYNSVEQATPRRVRKSNKKPSLPYATVAKIAHSKHPGVRIESAAIEMLIAKAEELILLTIDNSVPFMEHRGGTMIMAKDVEAYFTQL